MAILNPEVFVTPDRPIIQLRTSRDTFKEGEFGNLLNRILQAQGWGLGTYFSVQFIDHSRENVLEAADFMVIGVQEGIQTTSPTEYQSITRAVFARKFVQITSWWVNEDIIAPQAVKKAAKG